MEVSNGDKIRVRSENLQALDYIHLLLITPTALDDPANRDFTFVPVTQCSRAGVQEGLASKPPTFTLEPGRPTDPGLGRPSMRIINGRRFRTKTSPAEQAFLADQERCLTGF